MGFNFQIHYQIRPNHTANSRSEDYSQSFEKHQGLLEKANDLVTSMRTEVIDSNAQLNALEGTEVALNLQIDEQGKLIDDLQTELALADKLGMDRIFAVEGKLENAVSELEVTRTELTIKEEECMSLHEQIKKQVSSKPSPQLTNLRRLIEDQQDLLAQRDASLHESQIQVENLLRENERLQFDVEKTTRLSRKKENNENVVNDTVM